MQPCLPALAEYFPHVWIVVFGSIGIAAAGFFVPPGLTAGVGLSLAEHVLLVGAAEFGVATGLGGLVVYYRNPGATWEREWEFDP